MKQWENRLQKQQSKNMISLIVIRESREEIVCDNISKRSADLLQMNNSNALKLRTTSYHLIVVIHIRPIRNFYSCGKPACKQALSHLSCLFKNLHTWRQSLWPDRTSAFPIRRSDRFLFKGEDHSPSSVKDLARLSPSLLPSPPDCDRESWSIALLHANQLHCKLFV